MRVRDIMTTGLVTANPTTLFKDAVELILANDISSLPVVDADGQLVGLVTESDLLAKEAYPERQPRALAVIATAPTAAESRWRAKGDGLSVGELMSSDLVTCLPGEDVHVVARRMLRHNVHQLPVVMDDKLVGIVSRQDILATFDRPDADIESEVRRLIDNSLWIPQGHARISVLDGVVLLCGTVRYRGDIVVVSRIVSNVRGVVAVINRLVPPDSSPPTEAESGQR